MPWLLAGKDIIPAMEQSRRNRTRGCRDVIVPPIFSLSTKQMDRYNVYIYIVMYKICIHYTYIVKSGDEFKLSFSTHYHAHNHVSLLLFFFLDMEFSSIVLTTKNALRLQLRT